MKMFRIQPLLIHQSEELLEKLHSCATMKQRVLEALFSMYASRGLLFWVPIYEILIMNFGQSKITLILEKE